MGLYHDNKGAPIGTIIECPVCHKKFEKKQYSQAFCSLECKDRFWNANRGKVNPDKKSAKWKDNLFAEIKQRMDHKRDSLDMTECPWPKDQQETYKEGWRQAFMFAIDIVAGLLKAKEDEK